MVHCRSLTDSLRKIGFFSNKAVFWGIGVVLTFQSLFIYLPLLQKIFNTVSLSVGDLGIAFLAALTLFPVISLEKWIRSLKR